VWLNLRCCLAELWLKKAKKRVYSPQQFELHPDAWNIRTPGSAPAHAYAHNQRYTWAYKRASFLCLPQCTSHHENRLSMYAGPAVMASWLSARQYTANCSTSIELTGAVNVHPVFLCN
jgi:hypothetical protein